MSYRSSLSTNAQDDIRRIKEDRVRQYVMAQLINLENDPALLSHRSHFPWREQCQVFSFDYDYGARRYFINVLFQYGADEQTLSIDDIAVVEADNWWE